VCDDVTGGQLMKAITWCLCLSVCLCVGVVNWLTWTRPTTHR